jgi:YHS domain-containing protein
MRTLFIVLVGALILLAAFSFLRRVMSALMRTWIGRSGSITPPSGPPSPSGRLERDPVCGTYVVAGAALKTSLNNEQQFFCSIQCRDKYLRSRSARSGRGGEI